MREEPFAIILPDEASVTAPIAAATELTKQYINAANKLAQLELEIWSEDITNVDGEVVRTVTHIPRDYKWLMEYCRKIAEAIGRINSTAETKNIDQKLQLLDIFMKSDSVSKEIKDNFVEMALKRKVLG